LIAAPMAALLFLEILKVKLLFIKNSSKKQAQLSEKFSRINHRKLHHPIRKTPQ